MYTLDPDAHTNATATTRAELSCYHCGDSCDSRDIVVDEKVFCCSGCRTVYELLEARNLCAYYDIAQTQPGVQPKDHSYTRRFEFLDDPTVTAQLVDFTNEKISIATFHVPSMHCSSCIWLLEKLGSLHAGVLKSLVNFPRKEVTITFDHARVGVRELVVLLSSIGYEPLISLQNMVEKRRSVTDRKLYYRIAVAGFAFGNVMLFSFPEYLAGPGALDPTFKLVFGGLNAALSIPVFLYSAMEFFRSAWIGVREKSLNIDVPISLGIAVLFLRSVYDFALGIGPGYFDSFTGLVFFMLIGRIFQKKSYDALSFDRDFRSYFPLSVTVMQDGHETSIPLTKLEVGERIVVRNQELVPSDAVLLRGDANIDYSFVTGESELVARRSGDLIHAGGRQHGQAIELEVVKELSHSYLTRLWNNDVFTKQVTSRMQTMVHRMSASFTAIILVIAVVAAIVWLFIAPPLAVPVFTAVLIVACPCALALSTPFALGSAQRICGNRQMYCKNPETVEAMARVDTVVFDKTGTLTQSQQTDVSYHGAALSTDERARVAAVVRHSTHPLSRRLHAWLATESDAVVADFEEAPGLGLAAMVDGLPARIGSGVWVSEAGSGEATAAEGTTVHVALGGSYKGYYRFHNAPRKGLAPLIASLKERYTLIVLSGDSSREEDMLRGIFGADVEMRFQQSPADKLRFIEELRRAGRHVLMVGDGLNDAGALKAADVGVSVSEDINTFSPACDAILSAEQFHHLDRFLRFAKLAVAVVLASFAISITYNVVGLSFAVTGRLSPLVSAILMPVSSVTVVAFTTVATRYHARRLRLS
jgi:P-type Cu+ transporter